MDLQEWELLPDDGFLEIHDDGGKKIFSRKYRGSHDDDPTSVFKMNYFVCPSPKSQTIADDDHPPENPRVPIINQLVPVPIQLDHEPVREATEVPTDELSLVPSVAPVITEKIKAPNLGGDQDSVSLVFFKKMKENEFVDMKMDSPKSSGRGILVPQIDAAGMFQFEDRINHQTVESYNKTGSKNTEEEEKEEEDGGGEEAEEEKNNGGLNLWKWSLTGIGAICSFGVAAATICIIIFGTHQKKQNPKRQFQIYTSDHDKRIEQVVHHATKLNEAISAVRGVPLARDQITIGGYYEGH